MAPLAVRPFLMMRAGAITTSLAAGVVAVAPAKESIVMLSFLGMPFAAGSMIAALFGCSVTRVIIGMADKTSRWFVRLPVDILAIGVTFFFVVERSPELFAALGSGIFIGTLGATIIKIAERWGGKIMSVVIPDIPPAPPPTTPPTP